MENKNIYLGKTLGSFFIVLLLMPLGHALMILMEHFLEPTPLHVSAFLMGFVGLVITILGVFQKGDTRQTIWGITGAMFFWTGWVEFLLAYYAQRYGVHCDLVGSGFVQTTSQYVDGVAVHHDFLVNGRDINSFSKAEIKAIRGSRPEYLIMPATFGMWMMFMVLYLFSSRTGCLFMKWVQKHCGISNNVELRPMAHHSSIVVFMEWNLMLWSLYLLLMFCYDPIFLGDDHPITWAVAIACLIGSIFMFWKQLHIGTWGRNIRFAVATVIVFWSFVEIVARNGFFKEFWVDPMNHIGEMSLILGLFIGLTIVAVILSRRSKNVTEVEVENNQNKE